MDYQVLVRDFARRTLHNLELVREAKRKGHEAYEVTQLINSLLGLLVLPRERYIESIPAVPLEQLRREGWPEPVLSGEFADVSDLRDLIRVLRNSIAHFNIEFIADSGEIDGVRLANRHRGSIRWRATLTLEDLEEITSRFAAIILEGKRA